MCDTCSTASQHFSDATQTSGRQLQTSVDQGTSPDWKNAGDSSYDEG